MKNKEILITFGLLLVFSADAAAQEDIGTLQGRVMGPQNEVVSDAPIQASNAKTGEKWRTRSDTDGNYEFRELTEGSYEIRVNVPCCLYRAYKQDVVAVTAGTDAAFNIQLSEGTSFNTIGDDFGAITADILRDQNIPDLQTPRMPDGVPNIAGMWVFGRDPFPVDPEPTEWAQEVRAERKARGEVKPRFRCLPPSIPMPSHSPPQMGKFIQTSNLIAILYEGILGYRQIFLDGRKHPENLNPGWLGYSIGHWEGDDLVVETIGFNDRGWTMLYPRTENMRVVERYRRTAYGVMELRYTIEDPEVFKTPIVRELRLDLAPNEELLEFVCENNPWMDSSSY